MSAGSPPPLSQPPEHPLAPPPGPVEWFKANLVYFVILGAAIVLIYSKFGVNGLIKAGMVGLALGLVIFVHELGHFLAAKWCGVQVRVFSIGFGPALPGCSFQLGETKYMIGALPLGGFVQMLGEGNENGEAEEGDDSPRSFKMKSVPQRMLIMSAGVIMNVILGIACLMGVFLHGVREPVATVWHSDVGSPIWEADLPAGTRFVSVDGIKKPSFRNIKIETLLAAGTWSLNLEMVEPSGTEKQLKVKPRKGPGDKDASLGFAPPRSLKELGGSEKAEAGFIKGRVAQFARTVPHHEGEKFIEWRKSNGPWVKAKPGVAGWTEIAEVFSAEPETTIDLKFLWENGKTREVNLPPGGILPGDTVVATSLPEQTEYDPFVLEKLKILEPNEEPDFVEYRRRMRALRSKPVVFELQPALGGKNRLVLCGTAHPLSTGLVMRMGPVTALRAGGAAATADVRLGDIIAQVRVLGEKGEVIKEFAQPDPVQLPEQLTDLALAKGRKSIELTVLRKDKTAREASRVTLAAVDFVDPAQLREETPIRAYSPIAIVQLGLGYQIQSTIQSVIPGSPAETIGLKPGDLIEEVRLTRSVNEKGEKDYVWLKLSTKREDGRLDFDQWAFLSQDLESSKEKEIGIRVRRGEGYLRDAAEEKASGPLILELQPDLGRFMADRGLLLPTESRLVKAETLLESLQMGWRETIGSIILIYRNLGGMIRGDLSMENLGGPIEIAAQTFNAADDLIMLLQWIGLISINLAVVNFLPLPPLDGGHMVFLAYEGARGRPAPRTLIDVVTGTGFGLLLLLIAFVFFNDIKRRIFGP